MVRPMIIPHPRQRTVLSCPYDEILYGGAAGAGKSFLIILDWMAHHQKYGKHAAGVLFRNTYNELVDIKRKMDEIFDKSYATWREKDYTYTFFDGATLRLAYLDSFDDALSHKGFEYTWRAHDELTMRPTDEEYLYLFSRMRSPHGVPTRNLSASNPDGPGHLWVKKRFGIDIHPHGMVPLHTYFEEDENGIPTRMLEPDEAKKYDSLSDSGLPKGIRRKTRIFIPGRLKDNPDLYNDGQYMTGLMAMPEGRRKMLLDGSWDAVEGAFFSEWDSSIHVCKAFNPPADWYRWMSGDWGVSSPYCFLWFCQSPWGEKYVYRELYGCQPSPNERKGPNESVPTVAEKIRRCEQEAGEYIQERWLDASCFNNQSLGQSYGGQFAECGVSFQPSNKKFKDGSIGIFRDHLKITNGKCGIKFMDNCPHTIRTIPSLLVARSNPEQYDTDGEDHAADAVIYGLRRNIRSMEEIARERGLSNYNKRLRFGKYGAH